MIVVFAALLAGCAGNRDAVKREAEASYKLGLAFLSEGRPAPALRELSKAEALTPEDPEVLNALGIAYWARREHGLAEEKFRRAVAVKPDFSEAWNNLGALYLDTGRYREAIPVLENALQNVFYGTQERALTNLGRALHKAGRRAEAERRLGEALEVSPGFPLAHKFLGDLLADEGRYRDALGHYDEALRRVPADADLHLRRGMTLLRVGRREEARAAFEEAWRLSPGTETGRSAKTYLQFLE